MELFSYTYQQKRNIYISQLTSVNADYNWNDPYWFILIACHGTFFCEHTSNEDQGNCKKCIESENGDVLVQKLILNITSTSVLEEGWNKAQTVSEHEQI